MQETESQTFALPPPPPPPPLALTPQKNTSPPIKTELSPDAQIGYVFPDSEAAVISFYRPLCPVPQEGPSCGIAALCMASQFFGRDIAFDIVLETTKTLGFTNQGEMFSVYNMANLAEFVTDCKASVVEDACMNKKAILHHMCKGLPVLIPYDADKNKAPCFRNGTYAHWAVLCGICYALPESDFLSSRLVFGSCEVPHLYRALNGADAQSLLDCATKVCVYAYHGKSRFIQLWDFDTLLASSKNLNEVTKKYPVEEMVLPRPDPLSELRDKAVLLEWI